VPGKNSNRAFVPASRRYSIAVNDLAIITVLLALLGHAQAGYRCPLLSIVET